VAPGELLANGRVRSAVRIIYTGRVETGGSQTI